MESIFILIVKNIKANFYKEKSMEEVFIHIKVEHFMMANGIKIEKMALAYIAMQTMKNIKEIG